MASAQINDNDRDTVKMLISEATGKVCFDKSIVTQDSSITQGLLWNQNKNQKDLVVIDQYNWSGASNSPYPNPVPWSKQGQPAIFLHQGPLPTGSQGGVVYADGIDTTARMWLVAFDNIHNKVYVQAGAIGPTDWNVVYDRMKKSGSESWSEDPAYNGKAYAKICPDEGRSLLYVWFSE